MIRKPNWFAIVMMTIGFGYAAFFDSARATRPEPQWTIIIVAIYFILLLAFFGRALLSILLGNQPQHRG